MADRHGRATLQGQGAARLGGSIGNEGSGCRSAGCSSGMTLDQLEPSAQAPCTSATLRAATGAAVWAFACGALTPLPSKRAATAAKFRNFIDQSPRVVFCLKHGAPPTSSDGRCAAQHAHGVVIAVPRRKNAGVCDVSGDTDEDEDYGVA
jgi:hypothetical protein